MFLKKLLLAALFVSCGKGLAQVDTNHYYDLDITSLFEVDVETASKKKESTFDSPTSTSIITRDEIQRSGITTLEEVFRLVQGMVVREISNGNFDAHIRGLDNLPPSNFSFYSTNSISLIMIDGRAVYNHMNGGTFWESLPIALSDIEKIEIVRGPNSALYGPNAAAGVINIITSRSNANDKEFEIRSDLKFGSLKTNIANVALKFQPSSRFYLSISGNADLRNRGQETYYNHIYQDYVPIDSLIDYQGSGGYIENVNQKWPHPEQSKNKYGINGFSRYTWSEETYLDASFGYQSSEAQTVFMENTTSPLSPRLSTSFNSQLKLKHKGISIQLDETIGENNLMPGWGNVTQFKYNKTNAIVEYEYKKNNLSIRPGISYLHTISSDLNFLEDPSSGLGILNGSKELSNLAFFIKGDYTLLDDRLRFVVGLRQDDHLIIKKDIFTYQGAILYKLNEYHRLRAVTSKSSRAPFMADMYASYNSGGVVYQGNTNMDLMEITTHEIGYRGKLGKKIELDLEAFVSNSTNYSGLEFDQIDPSVGVIFKYKNYELDAQQKGISGTVSYRPTEQFIFSLFGTAQETQLTNFENAIDPTNPFSTHDTIDIKYTNTPSFFGGFKTNYSTDQFSVFANGFFMGQHTYWYKISDIDVADKFRLDLTVSYKFLEKSSIYVTGRNLLNTQKTEFGMGDQIGALYLLGVNLNL